MADILSDRSSVPAPAWGVSSTIDTQLTRGLEVVLVGEDRPEAPPVFRAPRNLRYVPVLALLVIQAALSLRLSNSVFTDEALYIIAGHAEISHLLHGTAVAHYAENFSGAPFIYPPLAGLLDSLGGLALVRLASTVFMLTATVLVFASTRRLFGYSAGLLAAGVFVCTAPTLFLGHLATFDPMAVMLLALAAYLAILGADQASGWGGALSACSGIIAALAALTKYAGLLFVPTVIGLGFLAGVRRRGWIRAGASCLLPALLAAAGTLTLVVALQPALLGGLGVTTTQRAPGSTPVGLILGNSALYVGGAVVLGLVGAIVEFFLRRPWDRRLLAAGLVASALLAPAYQLHLHTDVSLQKHTGYGLVFVAPIAGYGLVQLFELFRRRFVPPFVLLAVALLSLAANSSLALFSAWPNTAELAAVLRPLVNSHPANQYLVENASTVEYYLLDKTNAWQWDSTYYLNYANDPAGPTSPATFEAAVRHSYFDLIALSDGSTKSLDLQLQAILDHDPRYRLIDEIKYVTSFGPGKWFVWQRVKR